MNLVRNENWCRPGMAEVVSNPESKSYIDDGAQYTAIAKRNNRRRENS